MTHIDPIQALCTAQSAAEAAGRILIEGFNSAPPGVGSKTHRHDPVTVYDRRAEEAILSILRTEFPDHAVLAEESGPSGPTGAPTWIIDPLDGTNNFVRRIPHVAVSIALQVENRPIACCVLDPIRRELFTATCSGGAYLNGERLTVSAQPSLDGAAIAVGLSHRPERRARSLHQAHGLIEAVRALRATGCAALDLAYVAAGRFDIVWYLALSAWDVAAGRLLVEEAGGRVTALDGRTLEDPLQGLIASNGRTHDAFLAALRRRTR